MTKQEVSAAQAGFGGAGAPAPAIGMGEWFTTRARQDPQRMALTFEDRSWTYGELLGDVERLAGLLRAGGVTPGDRVAYLGFNHPRFFIALFAVARLGAIFVPLNFRLTGHELEFIVNDAGAHTLLVGAEHVDVIEGVRERLCCARFWCAEGESPDAARWPLLASAMAEAEPLAEEPVPTAQDDVAVIMYTSGTTGRPKGAMLTHGNFWWNHMAELYTVDVAADDRLLVFAPVFHIGGLNVLTMTTFVKGGHVILQRHFDPEAVLRDLVAHRVTIAFAVPAMLLFVSQSPGYADADLSALRMVLIGGAPCPEPLLHEMARRGVAVQQGYGLTETAAMSTVLTAQYAPAKIGSSGQPPLLTRIRLIDGAGCELTEPGARGEVCVRGPNVMRGYWNNPEATRAAIGEDGWFRTGDIGYFDEDRFLYLCDRVKDMIISGGENVYPAEVESILHAHPAIAEVAVVGVPDRKWGERVVAVAALKPGASLDLEELRGFAAGSLGRYKLPSELHVVDALPRNPTGKILKYRIRDALGAEAAEA